MLLVMLMVIFLGFAQAQSPDPLKGISPVEVEHGKRLFQNNCAVCHGFDGTGGTGPSLARAKLHRAADNQALIDLITNGIEDGGMPPSWHLLPNGPRQVAAYVRTLGHVDETPIKGDVEHGRAVYQKAGCAGCHIVNGDGKGFGPELTDIGLRRTGAVLRQTILHPENSVPLGFLLIRAQTRKGPEVTGVRVNEDSFTIQLKDARGQFLSFQKADLVKLERQPGKTLMPSYATSLTSTEVDDLAAYLTSLRGAQ